MGLCVVGAAECGQGSVATTFGDCYLECLSSRVESCCVEVFGPLLKNSGGGNAGSHEVRFEKVTSRAFIGT